MDRGPTITTLRCSTSDLLLAMLHHQGAACVHRPTPHTHELTKSHRQVLQQPHSLFLINDHLQSIGSRALSGTCRMCVLACCWLAQTHTCPMSSVAQ